ncbi:glycosyltransferase family 61 protein [Paracoccus liaowanqingii]|uniref:Glycosyltransferase family 61 protein n=1 Tax=Paracoccus liaowanqingii TaxID=2560053 RepID=A0A4P7HMK0_9RHOB|nr:glycosyltransferase family 61 protein [Paracoccus liaowanqingii]QBX35479.1 glycosyltransferase family 61 protein [Paracoccus liaowanqingii]
MHEKWRLPPADILHVPTLHGNISYIGTSPSWIVRKVDSAEIRAFAASDNDDLKAQQQASIDRRMELLPKNVLEVRSSPVVLQNARFAHGLVTLGGRFWLNGASGNRARKKFELANPAKGEESPHIALLRESRDHATSPMPVYDAAEAAELDISIELKNGFNYYHFLTETLGSLAHYLDDTSDRPISLHLPDNSIKGFLRRFIDAIYPSLTHRVQFVVKPVRFDAVRSVYSHQHYLSAVNDPLVEQALQDEGTDPAWRQMATDPLHVKKACMQSYESSLGLLRKVALLQMELANVGPTPRLIWMDRDEGGEARARGLSGHEPLLAELTARGFEKVIFERLSPLEQIATMNRADIVIAPHGAGLANMVFAKPGARVIELANRQIQLHRWGDFFKCAHVSRCHYDTVFADIEGHDDPTTNPPISAGLKGVRIGARATDRIVQIVDETLSLPDRTVFGDHGRTTHVA